MSAATLTFDAAIHEYRLSDGRRVPSVTEILKATRVSVDFNEISARSGRLAEMIATKRELGIAVHADSHAFDDDDLDWSTVDPRVEPYVKAWATFRLNSQLVPLTRERVVFHPSLFYSGTLDGIFRAPNGRRILCDIKTGDPRDAGAQFQLAAYDLAYLVDHDEPIDERWSVQLTPELGVPYRVTPHSGWRDVEIWRAIVATYYAQPARRSVAA